MSTRSILASLRKKRKEPVIIAIDVGTSGTRCSAYGWSDENIACWEGASRKLRSLQPNGKIRIEAIITAIEACLDEVLEKLRQSAEFDPLRHEIVALGFSTFCMNLVGVTSKGKLNEEATISYACNTDAVAREVEVLKR
jgi:sugar (pentulose or hexulose) kinase